jgi:hypothetical protein
MGLAGIGWRLMDEMVVRVVGEATEFATRSTREPAEPPRDEGASRSGRQEP